MSRTRFQRDSTLYSCLNVKELLARSRCESWNLSDCNWTRIQNHLVRKRTLNHLAKLAKWLSCFLSQWAVFWVYSIHTFLHNQSILFHLLWQLSSTLGGKLISCRPPFCTPQKRVASSLQFGQEENILEHSIERRAYLFILKIARMFPISSSRNRIMKTFITVNITSSPQRLWFSHSKKSFLLSSVWPGTRYTRTVIWKKNLLIYFEN